MWCRRTSSRVLGLPKCLEKDPMEKFFLGTLQTQQKRAGSNCLNIRSATPIQTQKIRVLTIRKFLYSIWISPPANPPTMSLQTQYLINASQPQSWTNHSIKSWKQLLKYSTRGRQLRMILAQSILSQKFVSIGSLSNAMVHCVFQKYMKTSYLYTWSQSINKWGLY